VESKHVVRRIGFALALAVAACAPSKELTYPGQPEIYDGTWSFVILPDTQKYAARYPDIFAAQTDWIIRRVEALDIRFVLHVGDIVDRDLDVQWRVASESLHALDGRVPYVLAPGNHDYERNAKDRNTRFSEFFPPAGLHAGADEAGLFEADRSDNSFRIVDTPTGPWLLIALEFGPRDVVLEWANHILSRYHDLPAAIVTHAYLYADGTRYDWERTHRQRASPHSYRVSKQEGGVNDGQEMWDKLVSQHENVVFVFSGHVLGDGVDRLTSRGAMGQVVHQVVANYQMKRKGGAGYLRLVQIDPVMKTARISTYSPYLRTTKYDSENEFTLDLRGTMFAP
jgi:hypothetical protein